MKILTQIIKKLLFLAILISFSSKPVFCDDENWGGILTYAYEGGQAYLLVALDSQSENSVWGDFSCELREDDDLGLFERLSLSALMGTSGVFAGVNNIFLLDPTYSKYEQKAAVEVGVNFFKKNLMRSETCVIKHNDIDYFLYFVSVKFIAAQVFVDSFNTFQKKCNENCEYFKNSCFAWLKIIDLIDIINQRKQSKIASTNQIVFKMPQPENGPRFFARASNLKTQISQDIIVLNSDLSAVLSSDGVLDILSKIINVSSSDGSKALNLSSSSTD